jgi:UDP-N-acetylmuramoyl-L-alanyl-D-glutamate--2,6-diaminopimelate ligase
VRLFELFEGFPVRPVSPGGDEPEVTGVQIDSRRVAPGDLFVAVRGARFDGRDFASDAVGRGAVAVLAVPGPLPESAAGDGWPPPVPWYEADDPRALAGPLAARIHGHPERELLLAAVTGTNGKSTVVALLASILETAGRPSGVVGTLGYRFGDEDVHGERTTPEAPELIRLLRRWRDRGAEAVAMEASSHALDLDRLTGLSFDAAVFTNLSQDHFDWHGDFEAYFAAKRRLFDLLKPAGRAAVNLDDPYGRRLADELSGSGRGPVTFGAAVDSAVRALEVEIDRQGLGGVLETPRGTFRFRSPLLGRYNLENVLAAAAAGEALELDPQAIVEGIAARGPLPGRLEPVVFADSGEGDPPFPVYVDYAHTPGALTALLRAVRELAGGRIILVFGAGGDRDRAKREPMGRTAGELADLPILTSDNPRTEDPLEIIRMVETGLVASGNAGYRMVPDRREAIHRAVSVAGPGDALVIAGKGHEEYQEVGDRKLPFSDRDEVRKALEERFGQTADR